MIDVEGRGDDSHHCSSSLGSRTEEDLKRSGKGREEGEGEGRREKGEGRREKGEGKREGSWF